MEEITLETQAVEKMEEALSLLQQANKTRESSVAITNLETALMWSNKDRTIKGQLKPYPTHKS